jgi:transposase
MSDVEWAVIAPRLPNRDLYRERYRIERFFNRLKHFRGIATRYFKTAQNFLAALHLASVRLWIRHNESAT